GHLYQGQSNDTYWHGVFGGVYITHLRLATWEHLIAAEDLADADLAAEQDAKRGGAKANGADRAQLVDTDLDGRDDVFLASAGQVLVVDLAEGAGIGEWDLRAARHALAAVLRRRPEASHARLLEAERGAAAGMAPNGQPGDGEEGDGDERDTETGETRNGEPVGERVGTIHDLAPAKEEGLADRIAYDWHERRSALVHLLAPDTTQEAFAAAAYEEQGDFVEGPFEVVALEPGRLHVRRDGAIETGDGARAIRVDKRLTLDGDRRAPGTRLEIVVENRSADTAETVLAAEWAVNLLG